MNAIDARAFDSRITPVPWVNPEDGARFHGDLARAHRSRLSPLLQPESLEDEIRHDANARRMEHGFVEHERGIVARVAAEAPTDPDAFIAWFEALKDHGPGQGDPLFPWLAQAATLEQMRWFLAQEVAGEAGFDDLVALTQVGLPSRVKLELARNYWDEMGQGNARCMHGPMLADMAKHMHLSDVLSVPSWETLALGNLMVALASNRRWVWQSIGALGVIELTAPGRSEMVNAGLRRLGVPGEARKYFALHATLDVKHSAAWNAEAIRPLVEQIPEAAHAIAEGALMRLVAGQRCFHRYRTHFGL